MRSLKTQSSWKVTIVHQVMNVLQPGGEKATTYMLVTLNRLSPDERAIFFWGVGEMP